MPSIEAELFCCTICTYIQFLVVSDVFVRMRKFGCSATAPGAEHINTLRLQNHTATDEVGSRELNRMEMFLLLAICLVNLMYLGASAAPLQPVSCCVSSTSSNIHSACEICTCSLWCKILQLSDVSLQTPSPTVQVGGKDSFQDFSNIHLPTTSVGLCNMLHGALSGGREFRLTSHEAYNTLYCGFIMRLFPVV